MINGKSVDIKADNVNIEAMYAEKSNISCEHTTTIALMKGATQVFILEY